MAYRFPASSLTYVALSAYRKRPKTPIARSDRAFLVAALSALPVWFVTSDPLWAVVTLTIVDLFGFGPTARRAHSRPHEERITFFALATARNGSDPA